MVKVKKEGKEWDYPEDIMHTVMINKKIRDDMSDFCKNNKINKGKLIEEFYKTILIKFHDGSLNASQGYLTLCILRHPITKNS